MLSKGGKIFYRCASCFSSDIEKAISMGQNSYRCNTCKMWGPWKDRIKQSVLEYFNSIRPIKYMRKGNNVFIESHGKLFEVRRVRVHPGMLYEKNDREISNRIVYGLTSIVVNGKE